MDTIQALWMGVIQGLTEYLPVSSSGHLVIGREILGIDLQGADQLQFSVALHVATVLSTIVVLWREFKPLCASFFTFKSDDNSRYVWKILFSCLPVMVVGLFFKDAIEEFFGEGLLVVGICLLITAALLGFAYFTTTRPELMSKHSGRALKRGRNITFADAFIIGIAQAIAVLPGLSRSGSTIATGIIIGDNREKVARFSFFMVIIPILGEALLDIKEMITEGVNESIGIIPLVTGFLASFIVGCFACKWMLSIVRKGRMVWFAIYCLAVGLVCIFW